ncbi:Prophage integrase IntA [invertebrate metagenome]|uniref:Prophage integrase IntA n=1 Tax=invertebrate metagenome TaxID=1711999 RepID=A0A2H9T6B1_9ZZZZ
MSLTDVQVRNVKPKDKDYKLSDGKGLFLLVKMNDSKLWRFNYHFQKKEKSLSVGAYSEVSLKMARQKRDEARRLLDEGKDPSLEKRLKKQLNARGRSQLS